MITTAAAAPQPAPESAAVSLDSSTTNARVHPDLAPNLAMPTFLRYWPVHILLIMVALTSCTIDTPLVKPVVNVVLHLSDELAWIVSAGLMVVAGCGAILTGVLHRAHQANPGRRGHLTALLLAAAGWLVLGIGLFGLRMLGAGYHDLSPLIEGGATSTVEGDRERMMAFLMILVYIATGFACYGAGHSLNPTVQSIISNDFRLRRLHAALAKTMGKLTHLDGIKLTKLRDVQAQRTSLAAAHLMDAGVADILHAHARKQIAIRLGDPSASELVTLPVDSTHRDSAPDIPLP